MIQLNLFNYNGKPNVINKTLQNEIILNGLFYNNFDIYTPEIAIRQPININVFNYAFLPIFNRFYFVVDTFIESNTKTVLKLKLDVLKSYANELLTATGTVTQKENANKFISDRRKIYDIRPKFDKITFDYTFKKGDIIMITLKGNTNVQPQNI